MSGKYVIIFIFGTAIAAAVFAWSFQYMRGRRILELWGADNARLIRVEADKIELWELSPEPDASGESLSIDGTGHAITSRQDILDARGIIHARQSLIEDASFLWEKQRGDCQPRWRYALRFSQGPQQATVLLDTNCQWARLLETGHEAAIAPVIFSGWETFLKEQFEEQSPEEEKARAKD